MKRPRIQFESSSGAGDWKGTLPFTDVQVTADKVEFQLSTDVPTAGLSRMSSEDSLEVLVEFELADLMSTLTQGINTSSGVALLALGHDIQKLMDVYLNRVQKLGRAKSGN